MSLAALILCIALAAIFLGAEVFTNALEHLGQQLKISEGVTGSIFAAIATVLPEAIVPLIAVLAVQAPEAVRVDVALGAILGAPLMLSTVALFLLGVFAARQRGWKGRLEPERSGLQRDLSWFLLMFGVATAAMFIPHQVAWVRATMVLALVLMYFCYLFLTLRASARLVERGHATEADHPLYLAHYGRRLGLGALPQHIGTILVQLLLGVVLIVLGARGFVRGVEMLSVMLGVSVLVLSLLIIPVATELPEKVNAIIWIRRRRDTLAFGNITGAMVLQASVLPMLGLLLTPWEPRAETMRGVALTLVASGYLLLTMRRTGLRPYHLLLNGACYACYYVLIVFSV